MIEFRLDTRSGVPAYLQIVQQVKRAVQMGLLQPGDQLPTLREAVEQIAVNPNTVLKAYRELERDRLVDGRRGQGTFLSLDVASTSPATHAALEAALVRWVRRARVAGFDDDGIEGLLSSALLQTARESTS
jgi:GntR family transcriptional regulator